MTHNVSHLCWLNTGPQHHGLDLDRDYQKTKLWNAPSGRTQTSQEPLERENVQYYIQCTCTMQYSRISDERPHKESPKNGLKRGTGRCWGVNLHSNTKKKVHKKLSQKRGGLSSGRSFIIDSTVLCAWQKKISQTFNQMLITLSCPNFSMELYLSLNRSLTMICIQNTLYILILSYK